MCYAMLCYMTTRATLVLLIALYWIHLILIRRGIMVEIHRCHCQRSLQKSPHFLLSRIGAPQIF